MPATEKIENQRVYLDFDYTLFGSSSTDVFLSFARPAGLLWFVFQIISKLVPWRLLGDRARFIWRDAIRIKIAVLLNPGLLKRFESAAPQLMEERINRDLVSHLNSVDADKIVIVSFGLQPVIRALLKDTRFANCEIVAPGLGQMAHARKDGKLAALSRAGYEVDAADRVLTDNFEDDADLVSAVDASELIRAAPELDKPIMPYVPFYYTAKIKRSPRFLINQVFLEELPIVILAYGIFQFPPDLRLWACLVALFASMFLVYELGYAENDRIGAAVEKEPKLSANFHKFKDYPMRPGAWIYGVLIGAAGLFILTEQARLDVLSTLGLPTLAAGWAQVAALTAVWTGLLILVRLTFYVFNKLPTWLRVYWYVPLHAVKYLGFALFFALPVLGQILIFTHIVRTWALYAVRRSGGDMEALLSQTIRLVFIAFAFALVWMNDPGLVMTWQAGLILAFCVIRALPEARAKIPHLQ